MSWEDILKANFVVKTNFPDADFWLQTRGSEQNVGKPLKQFEKVQGKYNIGIKVSEEVNKEYFYSWLANLFRKGYWKLNSYGSLPLQHIRTSDVKKVLETYEDKKDFKDTTSSQIERAYEDWLNRSKVISNLLLASSSRIREGRELKRFLDKMEGMK